MEGVSQGWSQMPLLFAHIKKVLLSSVCESRLHTTFISMIRSVYDFIKLTIKEVNLFMPVTKMWVSVMNDEQDYDT